MSDAREVLVYTTEPCRFCTAVKALLQRHGIRFSEINLARDGAGRAELANRTGMMTFPQVLVQGTLIGGFQETRDALRSGALEKLLAA
jgi:glutaredoxin 3